MQRPTIIPNESNADKDPLSNSCLAKTRNVEGQLLPGRDIFTHCVIVGSIAKTIANRYHFTLLKDLIPLNIASVAAIHDIGKLSPSFQQKISNSLTNTCPSNSSNIEKKWGGHAGTSQVTLKNMKVPDYIPEILGQHHGFNPTVAGNLANDQFFGKEKWQDKRIGLIKEIRQYFGETEWPIIKSFNQARFLTGLITVSDWIGSGEMFDDPDKEWKDCIEKSLDSAGFIPPKFHSALSFEEIFGFSPNNQQKRLIETLHKPGIYIMEAAMGSGKTEAALYVAYQLMITNQAYGLYFALPSQLTSNKIHERVNSFLNRILKEKNYRKALLVHSNANFVESNIQNISQPGDEWFHHSKRGLLAPFAVGTIDQALMSVINVKHSAVRAFGLAGKVVIIDELHSYDTYTSELITKLVQTLKDLNSTVIILSATLNDSHREKLLDLHNHQLSKHYPLISVLPYKEDLSEFPVHSDNQTEITINMNSTIEEAIEESLIRAQNGQQVLWIENTVSESQRIFKDISIRAKELGIDCGLLHSRFTAEDRQTIEDQWVSLFGKSGKTIRSTKGHILIGTQILEQSLDIDSDFLVSKFCPTDMILQRLGRLWRHPDTIRPDGARREAWIISPELEQAISEPGSTFGPTSSVYDSYILCRSLEVWKKMTKLTLPDDIRFLIEKTYIKRTENGKMEQLLYKLERNVQNLCQIARNITVSDNKTISENRAQTRYSKTDNIEVLLLKKAETIPKLNATKITFLNGEHIHLPWQKHQLNKKEWLILTRKLFSQTIKIWENKAPTPLTQNFLKTFGFHNCFYLGSSVDIDESQLRVALVDNNGFLKSICPNKPVNKTFILNYQKDIGYQTIKKEAI